MTKHETEYQLEIKKSVIAQGGFAFKLSNTYTVGVPDLGIWLPPFAPLVAEVKVIRECGDKFRREIATTPKQDQFMADVSGRYEALGFFSVAFVLVVVEWEDSKKRHLIGVPRTETHITHGMITGRPSVSERGVGGAWDMKQIINTLPLGTMRPKP